MASKVLDIEFRGRDNGTVAMLQATAAGADATADRLKRMGLVPDPQTASAVKVLQKYEADITAIKSRAAADRLRAEGKELEAEVLLARQAAEEKKRLLMADVNRRVLRAPAGGDYAANLQASAAAKAAAIDEAAEARVGALQAQAADGSGIGGLAGMFGRSSSIGQLGRMLKGGGALIGLSLVAGAAERATGKALEMKRAFDASGDSIHGAGDAAATIGAGLAQSLPIVSSAYGALNNVAQLTISTFGETDGWLNKLSGGWLARQKAAQDSANEEKARLVLLQFQTEALERQRKLVEETAKFHRDSGRRAREATLAGFDREDAEQQDKGQDRLDALADARKQQLEESGKARRAAADKIRADENLTPTQKMVKVRDLGVDAEAEAKRINRQFDQRDADAKRENAADDLGFRERHERDVLEVMARYTKETSALRDQAAVQRLRDTHQELEAELLAIRAGAEQRRAEIDEQLKKDLEAAPPERQGELRAAALEEQDAADADAAEKQRVTMDKAARDGQLKALQMLSGAGDEAAGAELRRLQTQREITEQLQAQQRILASTTAGPEAKANARSAIDALGRVKDQQDQQLQQRVDQQEVGDLQKQAEFGGTGAERIAARRRAAMLKQAEAYRKLKQEAAAVEADPNATDEQKKFEHNRLTKFQDTAAQEYQQDVYGKERGRPTFDGEERGLLTTGVAAAARDHAQAMAGLRGTTAEGRKAAMDAMNHAAGLTDPSRVAGGLGTALGAAFGPAGAALGGWAGRAAGDMLHPAVAAGGAKGGGGGGGDLMAKMVDLLAQIAKQLGDTHEHHQKAAAEESRRASTPPPRGRNVMLRGPSGYE